MAKKALCVGVNDYPYEGNDLNGCVNDANAWADLLTNHFDFAKSDVKVLTDQQATRAAIMAELEAMVTGAQPGDVLVFTNSSHGTYIADTDNDERGYDEAICPYDCADELLVDDDLRMLFARMPQDAHLSVISDSCFSGTVTRAIEDETPPDLLLPDRRKERFLAPSLLKGPVEKALRKTKRKRKEKYPESGMKEILLSGCTDQESSYDARIGDEFHGAMTYYALQTILDSNCNITWQELYERVNELLEQAGYPQHPQLEGRDENKNRPIFS